MAQIAQPETKKALPLARPAGRTLSWAWIGVVPFFLFAFAFMIMPASFLVRGSLQDRAGSFTLENFAGLSQPFVLNAYWLSIKISFVTALAGGLAGFLAAYSLTSGRLPSQLRSSFLTFCGVASNFAGVPLALAFIFTIGRVGFVTTLLKNLGINIYDAGFNLYSFTGLSLVYVFFQLPLMVLIIVPALEGLRLEWREAAENLGANNWQYWRYIGLPILMPSLLGTMFLLFNNAFGAYATAYALTGGSLNLTPILIGAQIRGDVLNNPGLGYALAMGMMLIMAVSMIGYTWLQRKTERWIR